MLHSNGDAFEFGVRGGRIVGVRGIASDRVNRGRLGPKDLYGWEAIQASDRLTRPLVRRGGELVESTWDDAMGRVVTRCRELLAEDGGWGRIGFYSSGQLSLEDYYTLGVIGKAGIGTPHMDGNTRLCTATAASSLKASFGTDGQPGSYTDVDHCDAIALWGHNVAETQTVLWARMLDRRAGAEPPRLLAVDPRITPVSRAADVHLAPRPGTNLALMNAIIRELIERGWVDHEYVAAHTLGFEQLQKTVSSCSFARAAEICDVAVRELEHAAEIVGTSERLLSTVLQGFYQSNQATAAACAVNNIHLLRGMIGRPGAGVLQMNGQPTAQNNRECGADGDLPGFRNWENPRHVEELAELWNVDPLTIPHWAPPTHAMGIFRYAELGSIQLLWIAATNPAVSLPDVERVRRILAREELLVVVQDCFLSETAALADVVLPAATWGERTGTFTNADRTVHLSEKAIDPPGDARSDLEIFLDFADRMALTDKDDGPLITWTDPESGVRSMEAVLAWAPVRLQRHHLRPSPPGHRHPVALRRPWRRIRAALRERDVQHRSGLLRDLRPRPAERRAARGAPLPLAGTPWTSVPLWRGLRARPRADDRRAAIPAHDRPHRVSLSHSHEDRQSSSAQRRGAARVGRGEPGGCRVPRSRRR